MERGIGGWYQGEDRCGGRGVIRTGSPAKHHDHTVAARSGVQRKCERSTSTGFIWFKYWLRWITHLGDVAHDLTDPLLLGTFFGRCFSCS